MTSHERASRSRVLIPLVVAVLGIALGAGGIALLAPLGSGGAQRLASTADKHPAHAGKPLSDAAIRARIEPSVVDVTATLAYDGETASGTGFVVDPGTGHILTNNHVIRDATAVTVTIPATGQTYPASIVGVNVTADIAVLAVKPTAELAAAPIGGPAPVAVGAPVISFGNQAGAGGSPTAAPGIITGTGRTIQANDGAAGFSETLHGMLATTARIEPGDSGGPLAGAAGTVIGMDTAAGTGGTDTGYAIPIATAMAAERQIAARRPGHGISFGVGGFLGVILGASTSASPAAQQKQERGVRPSSPLAVRPGSCVPTRDEATTPTKLAPAPTGALVVGVLCGTGAAAAGITPGDVITAVDGRRIGSPDSLSSLVSSRSPGSIMQVTWVATAGASRTSGVRLNPAPAI